MVRQPHLLFGCVAETEQWEGPEWETGQTKLTGWKRDGYSSVMTHSSSGCCPAPTGRRVPPRTIQPVGVFYLFSSLLTVFIHPAVTILSLLLFVCFFAFLKDIFSLFPGNNCRYSLNLRIGGQSCNRFKVISGCPPASNDLKDMLVTFFLPCCLLKNQTQKKLMLKIF